MAKITNAQLVPNKTVIVRGKITFSHVTRKIEGEELVRRNQGNNYPETKPYTEIAICHAAVQPESGDPNNLTINEQYICQKCYLSKTHPEREWCFSAKNKGNNLPSICQGEVGADGKIIAKQIIPTGELANDLDVTLVLRIFQGKPNCGVSLDTVIVNEPIKYYDGASQAAMAARGITFVPDDAAKTAAQNNSYYPVPEAPQTPVQQAVSQPAANTNPFSSQAQAAAQATPVANAAATTATPAATAAAPATQTTPAAQTQATPFPMNHPEEPAQNAGPVANGPVASSPVAGGVVYDPNQRNY